MKTLSRFFQAVAVMGMATVGGIVLCSSIQNPVWVLILPLAIICLVLVILSIAVENGMAEIEKGKK